MSHDQQHDDAFAKKIATPLRTPESADATFEARVMSAVHAEANARAKEGRLASLLRPRLVLVTPLRALAAAAGLVAVVALPWTMTRGADVQQVGTEARTDTVHVVRFVLASPGASSVALVGEFNGWEKGATPLRQAGEEGLWTVTVPLRAGRHEYAFVVRDASGERWLADPVATLKRDEFGTESSVIFIGET